MNDVTLYVESAQSNMDHRLKQHRIGLLSWYNWLYSQVWVIVVYILSQPLFDRF